MIDIELFPIDIQLIIYNFKFLNDSHNATIIQKYWKRKQVYNNFDIILIHLLYKNHNGFINITNPYIYLILNKLSNHINITINKETIYYKFCYDIEDSLFEYEFYHEYFNIFNKSKQAYEKIKLKLLNYDKYLSDVIYYTIYSIRNEM